MEGENTSVSESPKSNTQVDFEYRFADFRISSSQQILYKGDKEVVISTKAYYMLLAFLENHGQILKKDVLINAVWPGQIVTDTALTKQIVRLRKLIGDDDTNHLMIETHRGVGYRFSSVVEIHETKQKKHAIYLKKPNYKKAVTLAFVGLIIATIILLLLYQKNTNSSKSEDIETTSTAINLAIIPSGNNRDWLNNGGLNYLSGLLDKNASIHTISPRAEWYDNENSDKLAIELTSNKNINYAALISMKKIEGQFVVSIKLRTDDKIISHTEIKAKSIAKVLIKTNNWITNNLAVHEHMLDIKTSDSNILFTTDNYALESYFQGLFQQEVDANQQKANEYFQAAINADGDFLSAWIKLLETHVHLAHYKKALAIAENTLHKFSNKINDRYLIKIHYLIAFSQFRLRDEEKAKDSLRKSIAYVKNSDNPFTKLAGLKALNLLAYLQKDWQAAEDYALQRIAIAKDYYPFPHYLAGMYLFLSEIVYNLNKVKKAKEYLYLAMDYYEKTNTSNGMITALAGLNRMNLYQNNLDEGVVLIQKATPYLENSTDPDKVMFFLVNSSFILNLRGYFDQSNKYIKRMEKIASKLNNSLYYLMVSLSEMHQLYVQNKFNQANNLLESMRANFNKNPDLTSDLSSFYVFDMLLSSRIDTAEISLKKYNDYLLRYPELKQQFPEELNRILGHIYVKSNKAAEGLKLLESAELGYIQKNNIGLANYIGFEELEILLNNPEIEYHSTIQRIESNTKYDYLFFKLKAQFLAREGKYFEAAIIMQENKQKANQLWDADDQLLLEDFQFKSKPK